MTEKFGVFGAVVDCCTGFGADGTAPLIGVFPSGGKMPAALREAMMEFGWVLEAGVGVPEGWLYWIGGCGVGT